MRNVRIYKYNVSNLPRGPHFPWKMIFEVDIDNTDEPVELTKMEFIQNKVFAYTEEQEAEQGKNVKVSIMAMCGETYNDPTFAPKSKFNNVGSSSHLVGVNVMPTEPVRPH